MYERYNGREIDDSTLLALARDPVPPDGRTPVQPPAFVDEDEER
jgi:hypothetical protein